MNRPTSVTIVGILQIVSGIFNIFDCLCLLFVGSIGSFIGVAIGGIGSLIAIFGGFLIVFAIISLILGLMSFILSFGLFQLKKWAWIGTFVVHIVALIMEGTKLLASGGVAVNFLTLGFAIAIIYYLMRSDVKQAFNI